MKEKVLVPEKFDGETGGNRLIEGVPEDGYHVDKYGEPHVSISTLKKFLTPWGAARAIYEISTGVKTQSYGNALEIGSAVHGLTLGVGPLPVAMIETNPRTNAYRDEADLIRSQGDIPLNVKDFYMVRKMSENASNHPEIANAFKRGGIPELSAYTSINGINVRGRFDLTNLADDEIIDLKTTGESADSKSFCRTVERYRYDMQAAFYSTLYRFTTGRELKRFVFVVVEKTAPYLTASYTLSQESLELAEKHWLQALATYSQTMPEKYPVNGHGEETVEVSPKIW